MDDPVTDMALSRGWLNGAILHMSHKYEVSASPLVLVRTCDPLRRVFRSLFHRIADNVSSCGDLAETSAGRLSEPARRGNAGRATMQENG
jgi:hypothetical protein